MNALWMPWNLIYIPSYESCKRSWYYYYLDLHREKVAVSSSKGYMVSEADPPMQKLLPLWAFPLCSSVCAATAAVCTHPIDVVKTRLQVRREFWLLTPNTLQAKPGRCSLTGLIGD